MRLLRSLFLHPAIPSASREALVPERAYLRTYTSVSVNTLTLKYSRKKYVSTAQAYHTSIQRAFAHVCIYDWYVKCVGWVVFQDRSLYMLLPIYEYEFHMSMLRFILIWNFSLDSI